MEGEGGEVGDGRGGREGGKGEGDRQAESVCGGGGEREGGTAGEGGWIPIWEEWVEMVSD